MSRQAAKQWVGITLNRRRLGLPFSAGDSTIAQRMKPIRVLAQKARSSQIWMTAVFTLFSGIPHFDCSCPDVRLNLFSSAPVSQASCCCSTGCCTVADGSPCCAADKTSGKPTVARSSDELRRDLTSVRIANAGPRFETRRCMRTLVQPTDFMMAQGDASPDRSPLLDASIPFLVPFDLTLSKATASRSTRLDHEAPPLDLPILLSRYLI